ncbi:hypothetical protein [Massilia sp. CF038]|uniref:hypothetical protein n=1 Tax=Massilia sp. CF038 TaxID=1881045 RepID=UPI00116146FA|nr:hypothetical protein [Massilia sp. CF038]
MLFRRLLAILLMFILPLQATLAAVDGCCMPGRASTSQQLDTAFESGHTAAVPDAASDDCCVSCDFCQHAGSACFPATHAAPLLAQTSAPPVHPDAPIHSFIPDLVPRPDLAA